MQALSTRIPNVVRVLLVFALGVATSLGIEIAQHYMTMRNTSVYDLGLNAISVLIGTALGGADWQRLIAGGNVHGMRPRSVFPLVMIAAWAAYRFPARQGCHSTSADIITVAARRYCQALRHGHGTRFVAAGSAGDSAS